MLHLRRHLLGLSAGLFLLAGCQSAEEASEPVTESEAALTDANFITTAVKPSDTDWFKSCNPNPEPGAIGCPQNEGAPDDEHVLYVSTNPAAWNVGRLLVYLPGTNSIPGWEANKVPGLKGMCKAERCAFYRVAADQGYHVIALSYFTESSASLKNVDRQCKTHLTTLITTGSTGSDQQMACIPQYMNEVLNGTPNCPNSVCGSQLTISQHPQDSIVSRLKSVLSWAVVNQFGLGWDRFLDGGNIKWDQVVFAGFSLGASYSAMIAQQHPIPRVAFLASPNDGFGTVSSWTVAPWLESQCPNAQCPPFFYCPDLCPVGGPKFFGLVHERNKMENGVSRVHETLGAWRALGMGPIVEFDPEPGVSPNFHGAQVLISTDPETPDDEAHESVTHANYNSPCPTGGCTIGYEAAWRHLVGSGL